MSTQFKNPVATEAHLRALFKAMRERKPVVFTKGAVLSFKTAVVGPLIIQRIDLDGIVDIYDQGAEEMFAYEIDPAHIKIK